MSKRPPGNKAMLGHVAPNLNLSVSGNKAMLGHLAPNLNLSVSVSSLSSPIQPSGVVPQPGLSSAAPKTTLKPGPKISEKSADLSLKVGKSGSNSKPLENLFLANPASESLFQEQQINAVSYTHLTLPTTPYV